MFFIAAGIIWFGYAVFTYGIDQIGGGNNGFLDLIVPGRFKNAPHDGTSPPSAASSASGTPPFNPPSNLVNPSPAPGQPGNPNKVTGGTTQQPNWQSKVLTP